MSTTLTIGGSFSRTSPSVAVGRFGGTFVRIDLPPPSVLAFGGGFSRQQSTAVNKPFGGTFVRQDALPDCFIVWGARRVPALIQVNIG